MHFNTPQQFIDILIDFFWMLACLVNHGMHVISGVTGEVEQIIAVYQQGLLDQDRFRMPGGKKSESPTPRDQAARPA
jgi:hypothetical protein